VHNEVAPQLIETMFAPIQMTEQIKCTSHRTYTTTALRLTSNQLTGTITTITYHHPPHLLPSIVNVTSVRDYATDNGVYGENQCACVPGQENLECVKIPRYIMEMLWAAQWQMIAARRINPDDPWFLNPKNLLEHDQHCVTSRVVTFFQVTIYALILERTSSCPFCVNSCPFCPLTNSHLHSHKHTHTNTHAHRPLRYGIATPRCASVASLPVRASAIAPPRHPPPICLH
jgi:hypothetical protein